MNKTKLIIWSVVAFLLICLIVYMTVFGNIGGFSMFNNSGEYTVVYDQEFDADSIQNITLDWVSGNVNINRSTDDKIKIIQRAGKNINPKDIVQVYSDNVQLEIKDGRKRPRISLFSFNIGKNTLDVYLPEKAYNEVIFKLTSGDIQVSNLACNKYTNNVTSGLINVDKVTAVDSTIDVTSGTITINKLISDKLYVKMTSGKVNVEGSLKDIEFRCSSGTANITSDILPTNIFSDITSGRANFYIPENDGFEAEYKVTSGNFHSDFELLTSALGNNKNKGTGKYKEGGNKYTFKITSGNIYLNKK